MIRIIAEKRDEGLTIAVTREAGMHRNLKGTRSTDIGFIIRFYKIKSVHYKGTLMVPGIFTNWF
jgi:hypothetical protein